MLARLDSEGLTLVFPSGEELRQRLAEIRVHSGLLVSLDRELALYDPLEVTADVGGSRHRAFACFVARVTAGASGSFDTALVVEDWDEEEEKRLLAEVEAAAAGPSKQAEEEPKDETEMRGVAAVHRIRDMNMNQKAMLAHRAGRAERQVLLRDNAPQVLQGLLANPRVEAKEILQIAKSSYASGAILQRIAGDSRWGKNQEILTALVRNPKTPTVMASRMVDKLRTSDLRQMAKMSSGLKEMLRKAALREYLKRSGG